MSCLARAISEINYQSLLIIFKWHLLIYKAWGNVCATFGTHVGSRLVSWLSLQLLA